MGDPLRAALLDPTGLTVFATTLVLAALLLFVPALDPWRDRATWVIAWGAVVYLVPGALRLLRWRPTPAPAADPTPPPAPHTPAPSSASPPYPDGLTDREVEVLRLIATGSTNRHIAATLHISVATAERHVTNIYAKIGARGRADATAYAIRHGLDQIPPLAAAPTAPAHPAGGKR